MKTNYSRLFRPITLLFHLSLGMFLSANGQHTLTLNDVDFDAATGTIKEYISNYPNIIIPSKFNIGGKDINVTIIGNGAFKDRCLRNNLYFILVKSRALHIGDWKISALRG